MKKRVLFAILNLVFVISLQAQEKEKEEEKKKTFGEHLFTGGSVSLAFYNNTFLIGASPVLGYSLTNFIDAGLVFNYNYTSYRDYYGFDDKLHQTVYGGGAFIKLYPLRFLFAQAQFEHNWIKQKYMPAFGSNETFKVDGNSFLIGGGYTTGRFGGNGEIFYYLAVLFDVSGNENSPYTDNYGRSIPIVRGGLQIPICQGGNKKGERNDNSRRRGY